MNTKLMLAIAAAGVFGAGAAIASPGPRGNDDPLPFIHAGEFTLQNGQVQGVADSKNPMAYRICVDKARVQPSDPETLFGRTPRNVSVKVMFDGSATTVKPGACEDISARKIELTPNNELAANEVLVGRYKHLG